MPINLVDGKGKQTIACMKCCSRECKCHERNANPPFLWNRCDPKAGCTFCTSHYKELKFFRTATYDVAEPDHG